MPGAIHQHVGCDGCAAGEVYQEPLTARFDVGNGLAGNWSVVVKAREQWVVGAEGGDLLAHEGASHGAGSSVDGIAFGHGLQQFFSSRIGMLCIVVNRRRYSTEV
jgi:hypothetical protein